MKYHVLAWQGGWGYGGQRGHGEKDGVTGHKWVTGHRKKAGRAEVLKILCNATSNISLRILSDDWGEEGSENKLGNVCAVL